MWELTSDRPVYLQLIEQIMLRIVCGVYKEGEQLPTVRDLAAEASVNPNTMQRALSELEKSKLVYTQRTNGRFITEDIDIIKQTKEKLAEEKINDFFNNMDKLGFNKLESIEYMKNMMNLTKE